MLNLELPSVQIEGRQVTNISLVGDCEIKGFIFINSGWWNMGKDGV